MKENSEGYLGYVRVSDRKQVNGASLTEQRAAIRAYAQKHHLKIIAWFEETVTAAKRGRQSFEEMMRILRQGQAAGVIMHKIDRGARNLRDWSDLAEMADLGVDIRFSHEGLDLQTRSGRLSADIQAVVAADYVRNLRQETRKGFYGRLKQGLYPLRAPLGYRDTGKGQPKTIDPKKGPLVRTAFQLYATGRYSLHDLQQEMHRRGLRNHVERPVHRSRYSHILKDTFYCGVIEIRKTGETFAGIHKPLISRQLFDRVQSILEGRYHRRIQSHSFRFRRIFTCSHCGRMLTGELQKGRVYYRCHRRGCGNSIREDVAEAAIEDALSPIQLNRDEHAELVARLDVHFRDEKQHQQSIEKALQLNKSQITERLNRLTDIYIDGNIDQQAYVDRRKSLLLELANIEEQIADTKCAIGQKKGQIEELFELAKSLVSSYRLANDAEKRDFLKRVSSNYRVHGNYVELEPYSPYLELQKRPSVLHCGQRRNDVRTLDAFIVRLVRAFEDSEHSGRD